MLSFTEGTFPSWFKVASVASTFQSQRSLSELLLLRITAHVESSVCYNRFQSAYRHHCYSTETAMTRLLNDIYLNANRKSRTLLLQLDLSAAYDTIDQNTLKSLLNLNFGIFDGALQWLSSYLSDSSQFVSIGGRRFMTMVFEFVVPQGSVLGPLLFSVRVTDRERNFRFRYQSFTVCWWHSAVYFTERWESSLSLLSASNQFIGGSNWIACHWIQISLKPSSLALALDSEVGVPSKWLILALFIFNRQKMFAVLLS